MRRIKTGKPRASDRNFHLRILSSKKLRQINRHPKIRFKKIKIFSIQKIISDIDASWETPSNNGTGYPANLVCESLTIKFSIAM